MKLLQFYRQAPLGLINCTRLSQYSTQVANSAYPYTNELYKKNYIKYPVQSRSAILHDYVFHGSERLKTIEERMKDFEDPADKLTHDCGKSAYYPKLQELKANIEATISKNKSDKILERKSRDLVLMAPIDEVEKQSKIFKYFQDVLELANHYNINKDLFTNGFFRPSLDLNIKYENGDSTVYYGNRIPAEHTTTKPAVNWLDVLQTNVKDKYHTLIFVNLDGNFQDNEEQVMLWCVANATNNDVTTGTELVDYMQPFPMRGSGWHRCVYLLLEHESPIQFDLEKSDGKFLKKRSFNVKSFLNKHKEAVVPVGLSFFQTEWDLSVRDFFHKTLDIPEPVYKLKQEKKFIPKFEKFPKGQAFNWYLQEYNDRKDINEHIIKNYLKDITPLNCENTPAKYPILDVKSIKPRWLKYEIENKRLRKQEWNISPHKYSHNIERKKTLLKNLPYQ